MVERRLGRGLDFFLSRTDKVEKKESDPQEVELSALKPSPFQPRTDFDEAALAELAESIRANGVIQPILVRQGESGLEIVAGERRWRAAKLAGLERIPVVVRQVADDAAAVLALVENVQRTDLGPLEKARAFQKLTQLTGAKHDEIAKRLGLDRSTVTNFVRLLDLSEPVQALVSRGTLSMGHARALLGLESTQQQALADRVVRERMSVRDVETKVQELKSVEPVDPNQSKGGPGAAAKKGRPIWLNEIEDTLAEVLGTSVQVRYGRKRSTITIECRGRPEFERIYELLKGLDSDA
ncbi:MAG: ParB/RepB/Spo0J family partition protein [Planctomycetota bacterium]